MNELTRRRMKLNLFRTTNKIGDGIDKYIMWRNCVLNHNKDTDRWVYLLFIFDQIFTIVEVFCCEVKFWLLIKKLLSIEFKI